MYVVASVFSAKGFAVFAAALATYVFFCWLSSRIGKRFGIGSFGAFCVPIYNCVLLCHCADISGWNVLWTLVPIANLIFVVYLWGTIAERLGRNFWVFGIGMLFLAVPIFILAFDNGRFDRSVWGQGPSIYCTSGEYAGNRIYVPTDGLVIGRNRSQAHLILSSQEISGVHLRIWLEHHCDGVWVQDMQSVNGTYYSAFGPPSQTLRWEELSQPAFLTVGTHIRLGDNVAEFVVS